MANTSDELFEAIEAGDVGRVDAILESDPPLASSRDASGVSALMRARYRFDNALTEAVERRLDVLDVFEAAAFGDVDRLTQILGAEPSLVNDYSGDGFTALHFAAFFGRHDAAALLTDTAAQRELRTATHPAKTLYWRITQNPTTPNHGTPSTTGTRRRHPTTPSTGLPPRPTPPASPARARR